jgi:hypothetical protein
LLAQLLNKPPLKLQRVNLRRGAKRGMMGQQFAVTLLKRNGA